MRLNSSSACIIDKASLKNTFIILIYDKASEIELNLRF